jgi:hypothetical protein
MYAYEKLMQEYNLKESDLTKKAKVAITAIKNIEKSLVRQKGKSNFKGMSDDTREKIEINDQFAVDEIEMMMDNDDDDSNADNQKKETIVTLTEEEKKGNEIESELKKLVESNKLSYSIDELRNLAPTTYEEIWDNYEDDEENGVGTSNFKIMEDSNNLFTVTKK